MCGGALRSMTTTFGHYRFGTYSCYEPAAGKSTIFVYIVETLTRILEVKSDYIMHFLHLINRLVLSTIQLSAFLEQKRRIRQRYEVLYTKCLRCVCVKSGLPAKVDF